MNHQANHPPVAGTDATPLTGKTVRLSPVPIEYFDEYAVVARLGQGGMAEVILGLSEGPHGFRKLAAIKRLHLNKQDDAELVRMFLQEANLSARLHHPHVVQTFKIGRADGRYFMAMEYLEGQPLNRLLHRLRGLGAALEPTLAARLASDALDGLHYAHEALDYDGRPLGIVHRDISPHNLFVTFEGHVKLLDFGIAKAAGSDAHTRPGCIKGKLGYIAPEQARSLSLDGRADVWSMGVTLWECLAGQRLFQGDSDAGVLRALLMDELPRLAELRPELPEPLIHIVERALRRERGERYATARDMKDALDAWLAAQGEQAREAARAALAETMQTLFAETIRERRSILRACVAQLDLLGSRAEVAQPLRESVESARPVPSPRRNRQLKLAAVLVAALAAALVALFTGEDAGSANAQVTTPGGGAGAALFDATREARAPVEAAAAQPVSRSEEQASERAAAQVPSARARFRRAQPKPASSEEGPVAEPAESAPSTPAAVPSPRGRLVLDSVPYSIVYLGEQRIGITPVEVELPAATHTLTLRNPERGIETTYQVKVPHGESISRRVALE